MANLIVSILVIVLFSASLLLGVNRLNVDKYNIAIEETNIENTFRAYEIAIEAYKKNINIYPKNGNWIEDIKSVGVRVPEVETGVYTYQHFPAPNVEDERVGICFTHNVEKELLQYVEDIHLKGVTVLAPDCFKMEDEALDLTGEKVKVSLTKWIKVDWSLVNPDGSLPIPPDPDPTPDPSPDPDPTPDPDPDPTPDPSPDPDPTPDPCDTNPTKADVISMIVNGDDVTGIDTSCITDFSYMFSNNPSFNQDISGWNVSNGTNFSYMFHNTGEFNIDISSWNMSKATDLSFMFKDAKKFNKNINSWNVESVFNFISMFEGSKVFNQNLDLWNPVNGLYYDKMFYYSEVFNQDVSGWDVVKSSTWGMFNANSKLPHSLIPIKFVGDLVIGNAVYTEPLSPQDIVNYGFPLPEDYGTGDAVVDWQTASDVCDLLIKDGYSDWYLPDVDELSLLHSTFGSMAVTPFNWSTFRQYWTSSIAVTDFYSISLHHGVPAETPATDLDHVSCIRYF